MAGESRPDRELRNFARVLVRDGYLTEEQVRAEVAEAASAGAPLSVAPGPVVDQALAEWREEARTWAVPTDVDRLEAALRALAERGVLVLAHCADHFEVSQALRGCGESVTGVVFFTDTDVWHAVDHGMLELKVWHRDTAAVIEGDRLLDDVLAALRDEGLPAVFDEGRIEVSLTWRRRP